MTNLGRLIDAAIHSGVDFNTQGGRAAVESEIVYAGNLGELRFLTRFVLRQDPQDERSLIEVYKNITTANVRRNTILGESSIFIPEEIIDVTPYFHIDMSALSEKAKELLKEFYAEHIVDDELQKNMDLWLTKLVLCESDQHILNLENFLESAAKDLNGISARLVRKLLSISASPGSYSLGNYQEVLAFHHATSQTTTIFSDSDPAETPNMRTIVDRAQQSKHKIVFSPRVTHHAETVTTPFGNFDITHQYTAKPTGIGGLALTKSAATLLGH